MGPTASGKTALALALAHRYGVEVINADARQLYRDAPIGTGVPTGIWQMTPSGEGYFIDGIRHHLMAISASDEVWTVSRWQKEALAAIDGIHARGQLPLVVGGTGLYIRALCEGYIFSGEPDHELRQNLLASSPEERRARFIALDPEAAAQTDLQNPHRVLRALERALSGVSAPTRVPPPFSALKLTMDPAVDVLKANIRARIDAQWSAGWLAEVRTLLARGVSLDSSLMQSIGFRTIARALSVANLDEANVKAQVIRETWLYARRQRTWFRKEPSVQVIHGEADAISLIEPWLSEASHS